MKHNRIGVGLLTCLGLANPGLIVPLTLAAQEPKLRNTLNGHTDVVYSVAFSPDRRTLASASQDKTVKLWEVATGKEQATLQGHMGSVFSVAFSPDGKALASGSGDKTVKLWDLAVR